MKGKAIVEQIRKDNIVRTDGLVTASIRAHVLRRLSEEKKRLVAEHFALLEDDDEDIDDEDDFDDSDFDNGEDEEDFDDEDEDDLDEGLKASDPSRKTRKAHDKKVQRAAGKKIKETTAKPGTPQYDTEKIEGYKTKSVEQLNTWIAAYKKEIADSKDKSVKDFYEHHIKLMQQAIRLKSGGGKKIKETTAKPGTPQYDTEKIEGYKTKSVEQLNTWIAAYKKEIADSKDKSVKDFYEHHIKLMQQAIRLKSGGGKKIKESLSADQLKLVKAVLSNDENSTDEELVDYFMGAGISKSDAQQWVAKRDKFLNS
jgi:hypothetical protein